MALLADITIVIILLVSIGYFFTEVYDRERPNRERLQAVFILMGLFVFLILMGGIIGRDLALM